MFRQRLAGAFIGIPVVLAATWYGGLPFFFILLIAGAAALRELYEIAGLSGPSLRLPGYLSHLFLFAVAYGWGTPSYFLGLVAAFIAINIYWVLSFPKEFSHLSILYWGIVYVTTLLAFFLWIRQAADGFLLVAAVLAAVWASDTGAYLIGMTLGRRKLMPAVSPKKSVEGAAGGMLSAAVALALLGPSLALGVLHAALLGALFSLLGQLGDLAESALKRWANVKDSGSFLPGHGGVLDRIDSLLFVAPAAYLFFILLR